MVGKDELRERLVEAVTVGGAQALLVDAKHPFRILVRTSGFETAATVFVYNLTHGGGQHRPAAEQRIQITHRGPLEPAASGDQLLILGYREDDDLFVAYDSEAHRGEHGHSSSFQISQDALERAARDGVAIHRRANHEIAVAFRPEFLGSYIENQHALHDELVADEEFLEGLVTAVRTGDTTPQQRTTAEGAEGAAIRERIVRSFTEAQRDRSFAKRVLTAYEHRCAACGLQLGLIDAAHIVPVALGGTDESCNGLALCALHHRAYDASLLRLCPDHTIRTRDEAVGHLHQEDLADGLAAFQAGLREHLLLPNDPDLQPSPVYLTDGDELRRRE